MLQAPDRSWPKTGGDLVYSWLCIAEIPSGAQVIPFQLHRRIPLLRRPFYQRDRALEERDRAVTQLKQVLGQRDEKAESIRILEEDRDQLLREQDKLLAEQAGALEALNNAKFAAHLASIRHHPGEMASGESIISEGTEVYDDAVIVRRLIDAYAAASRTPVGPADSFWLTDIAEIRRPEHETLLKANISDVQAMLREPAKNSLLYGFDNLTARFLRPDGAGLTVQGQLCYDLLLTLAEATGTVPLSYPEAPPKDRPPPVEELVSALDSALGIRIEFPNPYSGETGIMTSRGVASYRAVQALYQAWQISKVAPPGGRVLEIGGGLGRTAFYAHQFGVSDYTIIDLPLTGVAQGYFLSRAGLDVRLYLEPPSPGIQIMPPIVFFESTDRFDLVVNVDSFTEMAEETAWRYFDEASRRSPKLLSINHEFNSHRMFDVIQRHPSVVSATRDMYWLRRGYVSELVTFRR